ncbi:MAG: hypothetical protein MJZ34_10625 [Paludibacteraceae bacterium]|nr:hypothetical protein [Paludibacteraceae bacterium]
MKITFQGTLEKYDTYNKENIIFSKIVIKTKENGQLRRLLKDFREYDSNIPALMESDNWNKMNIPVDDYGIHLNVIFDAETFEADLDSISMSAKRTKKDEYITEYAFTMHKEYDGKDERFVIPYLKATREEELDLSNPKNANKKPKMIPVNFEIELNDDKEGA